MVSIIASPLHRLAAEARRRGVRILVEPISGAHFATSSRDPDVIYRLTAYSCSCPGFIRWGRCSHHALLLVEKQWVPEDDPEPPPPPAAAIRPVRPTIRIVTCSVCDGSGQESASLGYGRSAQLSCWMCGGIGHIEVTVDPPSPQVAAPGVEPDAA